MKIYTQANIDTIPQWQSVNKELQQEIRYVSRVLPFRVNDHVLSLIKWDNVPNDPIFNLIFPMRLMLPPESFQVLYDSINRDLDKNIINELIDNIRLQLNPHPDGQLELNRPVYEDNLMQGLQHKYKETVLFFPAQGQTCHSYCTFCFRWAQFIGVKELRFSSNEASKLVAYLRSHPEITNLIFTGGDPMVMKTSHLEQYIEPLLKLDQLNAIRIGSKALTFWPYRFTKDKDAKDLLDLFQKVNNNGIQITLMAHIGHYSELEHPETLLAIKLLQQAGVIIRSQAPVLKHFNDTPEIWSKLWSIQEKLGIIPYYMFIERQTGAHRYFELPIAEVYNIYQQAITRTSGLCRTARGPSMSTINGKIEVLGIQNIGNQKIFVLRYIQARIPELAYKVFASKYDPNATWFDQLQPFSDSDKKFFEPMSNIICDNIFSA